MATIDERPGYPRPCLLHDGGGFHAALCHGFYNAAEVVPPSLMRGGHSGGQLATVHVLVELETGQLIQTEPSRVIMMDSDRVFGAFDWEALYNGWSTRQKEREESRGI